MAPELPSANRHQPNPLRVYGNSTARVFKPPPKKLFNRHRPSNFAEQTTPIDLTESPEPEVKKLLTLAPKAVKPEVTPAASHFHLQNGSTTVVRPIKGKQTAIIDLTNDDDEDENQPPALAPMRRAGPSTTPQPSSLPRITVTSPASPPAARSRPHTYSITPTGHIQLPEPRQSHSAGYHRQHQGPRYKVLPAGFGGLDLARSHFSKLRKRKGESEEADGENERKVRRQMAYTLKRHVEEYWKGR